MKLRTYLETYRSSFGDLLEAGCNLNVLSKIKRGHTLNPSLVTVIRAAVATGGEVDVGASCPEHAELILAYEKLIISKSKEQKE